LRSLANLSRNCAFKSFTDELAIAAEKIRVRIRLQLLGPDRIIPQSELPKDYSNYGATMRNTPIDTARSSDVAACGGKIRLGKKKSGMESGMGFALQNRSFLTYVASVLQCI